jgi:hypothetical protein
MSQWMDRTLDDLVINGFLSGAATGQTFFVDNSLSPRPNLRIPPYRSVIGSGGALGQCTANQEDRILLGCKHREEIPESQSITKHGVSIIGQKRGNRRPQLFFDDAIAGRMTINADDVLIQGIDFVVERVNLTGFLDLQGSNITIRDCRFIGFSRSTQVARAIDCIDISVTDLASANGDGAAPVVTSATHSFTARDVNKSLHVTAGTNWTTGVYTIVSVSGGAATLDRAVGSTATLSSGSASLASATDINIEDCSFFYDKQSATPTGSECINIDGTVERFAIRRCKFDGDWSTAAISQAALLGYELDITDNVIINRGTDNVAGGIDVLTGTTGWIHNNHVTHLNGTANTGIDHGGCALGLNYISDTMGQYGKVYGTEAT